MLDIGSLELFLVLIVGLLVIGPQRLPEVAQTIASTISKARNFIERMKRESGAEQYMKQFREDTGLDEIKHHTQTFTEQLDQEAANISSSVEEMKYSNQSTAKNKDKADLTETN